VNAQIPEIYDLLQEIAWNFGSHGVNGECCMDLSLVEFIAIKRIYSSADISVQQLGSALNFTKSGATRVINRLEKKGYVSRVSSSEDGRVCCVAVTEKGKNTLLQITNNYSDYLDDVLKDLEPACIDQIKVSLMMLSAAVQHHRPFAQNVFGCKEGDCV
jgi:DNA-binding MarR family transcriptional regulator